MTDPEFHPDVRLGHVHLRVADLARASAFYRGVLGFEVTAYGPDFGLSGAAFLSARGYHHHVGLNTWDSKGGTPPPEGHTGLYHFALLYPDRRELGRAVRQTLVVRPAGQTCSEGRHFRPGPAPFGPGRPGIIALHHGGQAFTETRTVALLRPRPQSPQTHPKRC
jgi:catechol 2,3-dioxygenase-like lactoylglutathione lyase family enzyme